MRGDAGREPVIVAEPDFGGGDRVVFVDHRHAAQLEQCLQRGARVEIAAALLGIAEGQQNLRRDDVLARKNVGIGFRQAHLSRGGGGLAFFQPERAGLAV